MSVETRETATEILTRLTGPGGEFELAEATVLGSRMTVFKNRKQSLSEVLAESVRHGERDYIVTAERRLTFAEHAEQVASLSTVFREEYGIGKGDRVAILAANSPEWVVAFWATVRIGAIAVGYNAWWSRREIEYALGHTGPALVIADAKRAALIHGDRTPVLTVEEDLPRIARQLRPAQPPTCDIDEDDPAVILYTSGTTGQPKGVVHTHRSLTSVIEYHRLNDALTREVGSPLEPSDRRYLLALPLFHIASLHNLAVPRLASGSTVVMHQGAFDVDEVLRLIEAERVTNWGAVPTMAHRLVEYGDLSGYDLSSLTALSLASAPSSPALKERLRTALPVARQSLVDSYGLTETATAVTVATAADLEESPGTLGHPIPTVRLEIRDPLGTAVAEGEEGEVCVCTPFAMREYWGDPEATAQAIRTGWWLHTGDIGTIERGRLRLTSRRSDLILRGGENVYPAEIENALAEHESVRECIVIGVAHPDLGQEVGAVVVTGPRNPADEAELTAFVRDRLAYFKVPSRWRITSDPLPRNSTGKVIRNQVRI